MPDYHPTTHIEANKLQHNEDNTMSNMSTYYKGFTLAHTNGGWVIINCPSRTKAGPISPGPYSSVVIAENVINRIIADSY